MSPLWKIDFQGFLESPRTRVLAKYSGRYTLLKLRLLHGLIRGKWRVFSYMCLCGWYCAHFGGF